MWNHQLLLPLGLLIIALGVPSSAQNAEETLVEVAEGAPLAVECVLRVEQRATWRRDGAPLDGTGPGALRPAPDAPRGGRLAARLLAPVARAAHAGVYTCAEPPSHRVRVRVLPAPAAAAPPTPAAAEAAEGAAGAAGAEPTVVYYDVGKPFALNCTLPLGAGGAYEWRRNGTRLAELGAAAARLQLVDGGAALRPVGRSAEDDYGNYSCSAGGAEQAWELRGRPYVKLAPNTNVVEGQKLKISCKVVGKPYPRVWWLFSNESEATNGSDALLALGERARLETNDQGIEGGALVLEAAQRADAGVFWCGAGSAWEGGAVNGSTTLRVKDMYAALWPFLGICAEVLLLCAVILVYEKRRTKPELDDSDTDNHDQKKS